MDDRLYHYYETELEHLRHMAGEFAREFPKVASRLALTPEVTDRCEDPWVERLLEGFAYLAARVQLKFDAEFPRFTQSLLDTVYPHYLAPTPSMAVVRFEPDLTEDGLAEGFQIPRDTVLRGTGDLTKCEYRTAHNVSLWPLRVAEAGYHTRDLSVFGLPEGCEARAGIRIRLQATAGPGFHELQLDELTLHLVGAGETAMRLYEQCLAHCTGILVQSATRPVKRQTLLEPSNIQRVGFAEHEALIPVDARSFQGYRLLHEYFALPQRFMFVKLTGLAQALSRCETREVDVIVLVGEENLALEGRVDAENFALFCTPAINLFPKRADPVDLTDRFSEYHVVPDRRRPQDYEVYQIKRVVGHGTAGGERREFRPFYSASDFDAAAGDAGAYFVVKRVQRTLSSRQRLVGPRSAYRGSEVYLTLVDANAAPFSPDLSYLSVEALCTNRDLPLLLGVGQGASDFSLETSTSAPVKAVRCVGGRPRPPASSHAEGEFLWRVISHLSLNYLSLVDSDEAAGAAAFRDLLKLYADPGDLATRTRIDGLRSIQARPIVRPVPTPGPITFARGLEVAVTFDERAFAGTGVFVLGAVLAEFITKYVSMNSFTETVIRTVQRPEVKRWRPKIGQRHML